MAFSRRNFIATGIAGAFAASLPALARTRGAHTASAAARASTPVPAPAPATPDQSVLDAIARRTVADGHSPGVAIAVWQNGQPLAHVEAGLANLETATPVVAGSVFRIGSLTKQFAGALILRLAAEGKLGLDDDVRTHLPFLANRERFTIAELLHHTAGIHEEDIAYPDAEHRSQIDLAKRIGAQSTFFDFSPGTAWLYSNAGYTLVGAVVEAATGQPLAEAAQRLLFTPMGLRDTAFDDARIVVPHRASGYAMTERAGVPYDNAEIFDPTIAGAAGAIRSTVSDLCAWQHAMWTGPLFDAAARALAVQPGRLRDGRLSSEARFRAEDAAMGDAQYGLGYFIDNGARDGQPIVQHSGGIAGFASFIATHLGTGRTMACLCNVDAHPQMPYRDLRRAVFADVLKPR